MTGNGKLKYNNGTFYIGQFQNGKRNGYGKLTYINSCYYEGDWKDDKWSGMGKIKCKPITSILGI